MRFALNGLICDFQFSVALVSQSLLLCY